MEVLEIQAIPNQEFSVVLEEVRYAISIRSTNGTVSVTIIRNGESVVDNARAVSGMRIIPSKYQESGNFVIVTKDFEIPDYTQFGISQSLIYITQSEIDALRVPIPSRINIDFFNPIAALPLRFAPQGYTLVTP